MPVHWFEAQNRDEIYKAVKEWLDDEDKWKKWIVAWKKALETLNDKTVLVVGVGGVGSLCRSLSKNWGRSSNSNR